MGFGGTTVVVGGATIAGFFAAACSLPFDYVKTQMQKMKPDPTTGELPFKVPSACCIARLVVWLVVWI
jgi:solute carrier family 25 oxoglutarate transporter 11